MCHNLEAEELYIVHRICERLTKGRKEHGVIDPMDGRDWLLELEDELLDGLNYIAEEVRRKYIVNKKAIDACPKHKEGIYAWYDS